MTTGENTMPTVTQADIDASHEFTRALCSSVGNLNGYDLFAAHRQRGIAEGMERAAASDLLGACEYLLRQLADGEHPDIDEDGEEIEPFNRMRAAIRKAQP